MLSTSTWLQGSCALSIRNNGATVKQNRTVLGYQLTYETMQVRVASETTARSCYRARKSCNFENVRLFTAAISPVVK